MKDTNFKYILQPFAQAHISTLSDELSNTSISSFIKNDISSINGNIRSLSNSISSLSNLSNLVWVENPDDKTISGFNQLSVIKLERDKYEHLVVDNEGNNLKHNCLYIISSDYMDAYGQVLSNLAMSNDDSMVEYLGVAATKEYVDATTASKEDIDTIKNISDNFTEHLNTLDKTKNLESALSAIIEIRDLLKSLKN